MKNILYGLGVIGVMAIFLGSFLGPGLLYSDGYDVWAAIVAIPAILFVLWVLGYVVRTKVD